MSERSINGNSDSAKQNQEYIDLGEISGLSFKLLAHIIPQKLFDAYSANNAVDPTSINAIFLRTIYNNDGSMNLVFKLSPALYEQGIDIPQRGVITEITVTIPVSTVEHYFKINTGNSSLGQAVLAVKIKSYNAKNKIKYIALTPEGVANVNNDDVQGDLERLTKDDDTYLDIDELAGNAERVRKHKELLRAIHQAMDIKQGGYRLEPLDTKT